MKKRFIFRVCVSISNMKNLPPLPALRAFEAVARLGSVVRAADELHVTHGAVSQQLRVLESHLGISLLTRQGRRLKVNEDGRVYALRLRMALAEIAEATDAMLSLPRPDELVVAVLPSFGAHWLVRRLPRFTAQYPALKLTLRAGLELVDFDVDRVDVAIRMGPGGWEGASQKELFYDQLIAVASPQFNGGNLPRTPAEILAAPMVRTVESWAPWLAAVGLSHVPVSGPVFNDSTLVVEALRQCQGVTLTRRALVHDLIAQGELVQLSDVVANYANPYWLVWPTRINGTAKLQMFSEWLVAEMAAYLQEVSVASQGVLPA